MVKRFTFVIFATVAIYYVQRSTADDKPDGYEECVSKSGVIEADITVRPRKDTHELKCFWKCIMEKAGMIDESSNIVISNFEKAFPKATAILDANVVADIKTCIASFKKISTCDDMTIIRDCRDKSMKS